MAFFPLLPRSILKPSWKLTTPFSKLALMMFMAGEPMKVATKTLAGLA